MDIYNMVRPRKFRDMFDTSDFMLNIQTRIDETLKGEDKLAHAMLFHSDYPGTGKTSCARILASELNPSLPDDERESLFTGQRCIVCQEINAVGQGNKLEISSIDAEIKSLRDALYGYRYVIILNEVHKLTKDAQGILLSTTEDAPENVYIIMTTTEPNSLRPDLRSRLEKHFFHPLTKQGTIQLLTRACKQIGAKVPDKETITKITTLSEGRPREALILISQYLNNGKIDQAIYQESTNENYVSSIIDLFIMVGNEKADIRWSDFAKLISNIPDEMSAEKLKMDLLTQIMVVITRRSGEMSRTLGNKLNVLINHLDKPLGPMAKTSLMLRVFQAYVEILPFIPPKKQHLSS